MHESLNKHIRLVASVLFAVIIILAVGITRLYVNVSQNAVSSSNEDEIIRRLEVDAEGNRIFEGKNSLYGVADANDKIIVPPEWRELSFTDGSSCIASSTIGGKILYGGVDYEGNIVVPFIYSNITKKTSGGFTFYIAEADGNIPSYVIYNSSFKPLFMCDWDSCTVSGEQITLTNDENSLTYAYGENGLQCINASIVGRTLGRRFELNLSSRVLLSKLDCFMLDDITGSVSAYIEYAFTGNSKALKSASDSAKLNSFSPLFPDDEQITSKKLLGISDIFLYSEKTDSDMRYYSVSVIADTQIKYNDENGNSHTLRDEYKAVIRFSASDSGIIPISGAFINAEPDYHGRDTENSDSAENVNQ